MAIDEKTLLEERKVLEEDFNTTKDRIAKVEKDLNNMKNNPKATFKLNKYCVSKLHLKIML